MADPPICSKCDNAHWPFHGCPQPEQQPPGEVVWPAPPEGFREARFGEQNMLDDSLAELGFGAPATFGWGRKRS